MKNIKHLMDKHILKSRSHMQNEIKQPTYMTAKAREKVRLKKVALSTWWCTRSVQDYKQYTKARNHLKWECHRAQKEFEKKLAKESKKNPKAFYK